MRTVTRTGRGSTTSSRTHPGGNASLFAKHRHDMGDGSETPNAMPVAPRAPGTGRKPVGDGPVVLMEPA